MKRIAFIAIACMCVRALCAQAMTTYTCDFEDPEENAKWVLNEVSSNRVSELVNCVNKWYIGPAGGFGLEKGTTSSGLYISSGVDNDTLLSSYSNTQSVFIAASRTLQLAAGTYSVVFDWEARGSVNDGIFVFWVDDASTKTVGNWSDRTSLPLPLYITDDTRYGGVSSWQSSAFTFSTNGNGGKLVVLWYNSTTPALEPAGKVDNICLYPGRVCAAPTNVSYDGSTKTVSWNGNADSYDVMLYNYNTKKLLTSTGITSTSTQIQDLTEEGYYYINVRSVCGEGHSAWTYTKQFVWIKGARCIDLFDIGPSLSNAGVCYIGKFDDFIRYERQGTLGMVDNGPEDMSSMHTIHIDHDEIDPKTTVNGGLHTVPEGEIASIRLGAYTGAGESSRLEYKYTVAPGMSDLLDLRYAVVMESGGHGSSLADVDMNPTFTLNILDENGNEVGTCSQRYFVAGFGDQSSWHQEPTNTDIYWCEWSTLTVSLREYIGQTLTLRFTSTRCSYDTHPAHAYFTFKCRGGDLQGIACGDFSTDHFEAPDGFYYRWYRADDPSRTVIETSQTLNIAPDDPTIYLVDLIDKNNTNCYYTLEANPNPRFPQARATMKSISSANCSNNVVFSTNSHVVRINRQTMDSIDTDEPIESVLWNFGDGSAPELLTDTFVSHAYPAEGGEYDVTVTAGISGGVCEDSYTFHISLPDITTPDSHDSIHYCEDGTDRVDTVSMTNAVGCEYHEYHHHFYHPRYDTTYVDRICEGGRYLFPGDSAYYEASIDTTLQLTSHYGCDSTISLHLVVDPRLDVEYPKTMQICSDDHVFEMPYRVLSGVLDSVKVYFSDRDQQRGFLPCYSFADGEDVLIPLPAGACPDNYDIQLEFGGERCPMDMQHLSFMLTYSSSVVMQNGGFVAVQNADYNGGFEFDSYAWYKDGDALNVNASYIPTSPEEIGSTYTIFLTRKGEDYGVWTCPIVYNPYAQGADEVSADASLIWPTYVHTGDNLWLAPSHACTVYSILGEVVGRYPQSEYQRAISAPAQKGLYLVVFDNHQSVSIIVY